MDQNKPVNAQEPKEESPVNANKIITALDRFSQTMGVKLRFVGETLDQEGVKVHLLKAYRGEEKEYFAVGVARNVPDEQSIEAAATDLVKKLISKMIVDIPQGAVGFVVATPTGPGIRYDDKAVNVTVHSQSRHAATFTVVQQ